VRLEFRINSTFFFNCNVIGLVSKTGLWSDVERLPRVRIEWLDSTLLTMAKSRISAPMGFVWKMCRLGGGGNDIIILVIIMLQKRLSRGIILPSAPRYMLGVEVW
jgi:hypothetical protein